MRTRLTAGLVLLVAACGPDMSTDSTSSASEIATATATDAPSIAVSALPDGAVVLADFTVQADPVAGTFEITQVTETVEGRLLRTAGQAIWCEGTVDSDGVAGSGADDSVELFTVDGSIEFALSTDADIATACRSAALNAEDPRYDDLFMIDGVFCADVGIRSFYADTIDDVHVTLSYSGDEAHNPWQHPYGTGADPAQLRGAGYDAPSHTDGGLIAYGDIDSGANTVVRWFFKHGNDSPFQFTGQVWFAPAEDCANDLDDDCDGIIDNACREFADGSDCVEAADCASGVCTDDVCQEPTCDDEVQNGAETGVDCGGGCVDNCLHIDNHWVTVNGGCVTRDGATRCWGNHPYVAGAGATPYAWPGAGRHVPVLDIEFTSMAGGIYFACGATVDGEVQCWGALGDGWIIPNAGTNHRLRLDDPARESVNIGGAARFAAAHTYHACAVREDNEVFCWGSNPARLGNGRGLTHSASSGLVPPRVALPHDIDEIVKLEIGTDHTGVLTADGEIYVWGARIGQGHPGFNDTSLYGDNEPINRPWPRPIAPATHWVDLAIDEAYACGMDNLGHVYCPHLGVGSFPGGSGFAGLYRRVSDITGVATAIHDSRLGICLIRAVDAAPRCFGPGWTGYMFPWANVANRPTYLAPDPTWIDIDIQNGCAYYAADDRVLCWGVNDSYVGNARTEVLYPSYGRVAGEPNW